MVYTCVTSSDNSCGRAKLRVIPRVGMVGVSLTVGERRFAVNVHNKMVRYSSALSSSPGPGQRTMRMRLNLER